MRRYTSYNSFTLQITNIVKSIAALQRSNQNVVMRREMPRNVIVSKATTKHISLHLLIIGRKGHMKPIRPVSKGFSLLLLCGLCHQKTVLWAIAASANMNITHAMGIGRSENPR